jgi:glyoxylase-like metal-dependent hydrolase (beta-lactamase superfamily II)
MRIVSKRWDAWHKRGQVSVWVALCAWALPIMAAEPVYVPQAVQVKDNVYAIVGPLGQRSRVNAGLNANYGFVVTAQGVILIDSGASAHSAAMLEKAVRVVTPKPIRWVLNTGSQDHRWLGNAYFAQKGAEVHAMANTVTTQQAMAAQHLTGLQRFVGDQLQGTVVQQASTVHAAPEKTLVIDGVTLQWLETNAHFPGDTLIHLPQHSVTFTGDLVYVDRLLSVLPQSNVRRAQAAFERLRVLQPQHVVPGHGRVTDLAQATRETGDYYAFLVDKVGAAARNMDPMDETLKQWAQPGQFMHLQNFNELHRANMNRVFVDFESNP